MISNIYRHLIIILFFTILFPYLNYAQTYIGSDKCMLCHNNVNSKLGYNIYEEHMKTGHPYKLNPVNGAEPTYPANTTPGVHSTPPNTTWNDFAYVIGGYGWKARFVKKDGRVFTSDPKAQYNLETGGWVSYNLNTETKYDYSCFKCHTTGASPTGSWTGNAAEIAGTFSEPGIRCEGCHGPGSDHMANPVGVKPPVTGTDLQITKCGECHQRGGTTNAIPAGGGYIQHHEQINEMRSSKHGDGKGVDLTCASCHDAHIALKYPKAAGNGLKAIKVNCQTCHANKQILVNGKPKSIDCVDCHMAQAGKSAVSVQTGNGLRGDVKTHIWKINTKAVTKDSMFTPDKAKVKLDANGYAALTLDFACLKCHTTQDVTWASGYAKEIHKNGITGITNKTEIPNSFNLAQNYPNPFNPSTTIKFALPKSEHVKLSVYSINGELIADLIDNMMPAGNHSVTFDASRLSNGVYIYTISTNSFNSSKKMILMK